MNSSLLPNQRNFANQAEYISREQSSPHYKTIIPCNSYGRHDKFYPHWSRLIPAVIHKLHEAKQIGIEELEIWRSGEARPEFLYAGNLAGALLQVADRMDELPKLMNIGLGHHYSASISASSR